MVTIRFLGSSSSSSLRCAGAFQRLSSLSITCISQQVFSCAHIPNIIHWTMKRETPCLKQRSPTRDPRNIPSIFLYFLTNSWEEDSTKHVMEASRCEIQRKHTLHSQGSGRTRTTTTSDYSGFGPCRTREELSGTNVIKLMSFWSFRNATVEDEWIRTTEVVEAFLSFLKSWCGSKK